MSGAVVRQAFLIAETSNSIWMRSLTRTPPVSSGVFQVSPQSLRLIARAPSKPTRTLPKGSCADAVRVKSTVTGLVTSRIVRSPVTRKTSASTCSTPLDANAISGYRSTSRKSAERRCASRSALPVSMLAVRMRIDTELAGGSAGSRRAAPLKSVKAPRIVVTIAWRARMPLRVWAACPASSPLTSDGGVWEGGDRPTGPPGGRQAREVVRLRVDGSEIARLADGGLGGVDQEASLLLDGRPSLGVVQRQHGAGAQQPEKGLDDRRLGRAVAPDQPHPEGDVLGEPPSRYLEDDGAGPVAGDVVADRSAGQRTEQHGQVLDRLDRGVGIV